MYIYINMYTHVYINIYIYTYMHVDSNIGITLPSMYKPSTKQQLPLFRCPRGLLCQHGIFMGPGEVPTVLMTLAHVFVHKVWAALQMATL